MQPQTIIFIGPQGSGKGTQVARVSDVLTGEGQPVVCIQTGNAFRAMREESGYTAARVIDLIDHGELVPDFLTQAVVAKQLHAEMTESSHVVFDGFPRNVTQAEFVDDIMTFYSRPSLSVVYLNTPEAVVIERMKARGRVDDTDESIAERLRLYKALTQPVLAFYQNRPETNFVEVDGGQSIDDVTSAILAGLKLAHE